MKDIFEALPNHLHLARNSNAAEHDRWRMYNSSNGKYLNETGAKTAEECMKKYIEIEKKEREEWVNY